MEENKIQNQSLLLEDVYINSASQCVESVRENTITRNSSRRHNVDHQMISRIGACRCGRGPSAAIGESHRASLSFKQQRCRARQCAGVFAGTYHPSMIAHPLLFCSWHTGRRPCSTPALAFTRTCMVAKCVDRRVRNMLLAARGSVKHGVPLIDGAKRLLVFRFSVPFLLLLESSPSFSCPSFRALFFLLIF